MIAWRHSLVVLFVLVGVVLFGCQVGALEVPAAPALERPVVDQTGTLSEEEITTLSNQIAQSRQQKSYQIAVLLIPTLGSDEYLEGYSLKVARKWGIGEAEKDNGVLLMVVKNDRKIRIEVGRGLEGDLTDVRASRIIRNVITPKFKAGDFYGGISEAISSIQLAVEEKTDPKLAANTSSSSGSSFGGFETILFFVVFGFIWLGSMLARSKSWWAGGVVGGVAGSGVMALTHLHPLSVVLTIVLIPLGLLFDFAVSRNYHAHKDSGTLPSWWAGGGSFGGGGGGGSFGGGGFSGGGSSGSW
jgi:uncharacterized protein